MANIAICPKCKKALPSEAVFCLFCGQKVHKAKRKTRSGGNGTGSVYQRGKTWTASYIYAWEVVDGKSLPRRRTKGGFKRKIDAIAHISVLKNPSKPKEVFTLAEQYESFEASHKFQNLSKNKKVTYNKAFDRLKTLHNMNMADIQLTDLQAEVDRVETYYPARDMRQVLSHLYRLALIDNRAPKDLSKFISLPPVPESKKQVFSTKEVQALWHDYNKGNIFTGYLLLMIYTGLGTGELLNIERGNIDFAKQVIYSVGTKNALRKDTPIFLPNIIMPVIKSLHSHSKGSNKLVNMNKDNFYALYYKALERAKCRPLEPYSCRHTTATALAEIGIAPAVIKDIMRHRNYKTTIGYTHIDFDTMISALNQLSFSGDAAIQKNM